MTTYTCCLAAGYLDAVGSAIIMACGCIPSGLLCFFPSWSLLNSCRDRWLLTGTCRPLCTYATCLGMCISLFTGSQPLYSCTLDRFTVIYCHLKVVGLIIRCYMQLLVHGSGYIMLAMSASLSLYALKLVACLTYVPHAALLFLGSVTTLHGVHGVAASFSPEYNGPLWNIAHIKP